MTDASVDFPQAFLDEAREILGEAYPAFALSLRRPSVRSLRVNPSRAFSFQGPSVPWEAQGRYVGANFRPGRSLAHFCGAYYMQEASAMAPVAALDVRPGDRVLDLCAAPGGKSGQIANRLAGKGVLIANEPDLARAKILSSNLERLGVRNAVVTSMLPAALAERWRDWFDATLTDAPCSGEGMFRREPKARAEWSASAPSGCAKRQNEILDAAFALTRSGGQLVYSTCTFNRTENEGVVSRFLQEHQEALPESFRIDGVGESQDGMIRLWPHKISGEGQFVAKFRREGNPEHADLSASEPSANPNLFRALCAEIPGKWIETMPIRLSVSGDTLCALPEGAPPLREIRVLRWGIHLGQVGKGYIKPDHALAMTLAPDKVDRRLELDEPDARKFWAGHALLCDSLLSGWTLVTHNQMPLGWGKAVGGILKNHLPKGLRVQT